MLDSRLKLPCLAKALAVSRFAAPRRDFLFPGAVYQADEPHVAKWGN